jgi:hypothetical protein
MCHEFSDPNDFVTIVSVTSTQLDMLVVGAAVVVVVVVRA